MTWAADGNLYTSWGDGTGFGNVDAGIGVARIEGEPSNFQGVNLWQVPRGYNGGKSYGLLSVNGTIYLWFGPGSDVQNWTETKLYSSADLGHTWTNHGTFFTQPDGFALPCFLNFGEDYQASKDAYIYSYGYDVSDPSNITKIKLARVPKDQILNRATYEFFNGFDQGGNPLWTPDVRRSVPVFQDAGGGVVGPASVIYNQALRRYLLVVTHGSPSIPWQGGGLGIFDGPEPWGPWTTVEYTNNWLGSRGMFFANIPTKWISSDGKTFFLVFTGTGGGTDPAQDAYQHIRGTLVVSELQDAIPPEPPRNLRVLN